jgi:hypothetical protein
MVTRVEAKLSGHYFSELENPVETKSSFMWLTLAEASSGQDLL